MIQRSSAQSWGSRNTSPSSRGPGRGGIQKRRGGPPRVDKDGDLVMDAATPGDRRQSGRGRLEVSASTKSQGSGRSSVAGSTRGGSLGTQRTQAAILRGLGAQQANVLESRISMSGVNTLKVDGLASSKAASNPDGGLDSLLGFLERKASGLDIKSKRTVKIKKSHIKGDSVIITASAEDAAEILKLDKFVFAGASLAIQAYEASSTLRPSKAAEKKTEEMSQNAKETQGRIRAILAARYDANLKLLNLSALGKDPGLMEMGMLDGNNRVSKLFPVLMAVCDGLFNSRQAKQDAIVGVTLADNELVDISSVTALAQTFPDLKNLDLSRNQFSGLKALEPWRWKFRHLENLVMTSNPIEATSPNYTVEMVRWYPKLQILNGTQVRSSEDVAATSKAIEAAKCPIPVREPDFRDVGQVGENFVRQFLSLYDNDRTALLSSFYDSKSVHSISINMSAPRDPNHSKIIPPWAPYTRHSRNLLKITHLPARMSRRYQGVQEIESAWSSLPATRHPDLSTGADKYLIECHPLPHLPDQTGHSPRGVDGLILSIHGEFEEQNVSITENSLRSFSRTFVLGPGARSELPIRVVSDVMVLRAWAPLALHVSGANSSSRINVVVEQPTQEEIIRTLVERTGMNPNYAMLCLAETGWDIEKAAIAFNANKDRLPPDAFK